MDEELAHWDYITIFIEDINPLTDKDVYIHPPKETLKNKVYEFL